ncbi:MAG: hypothetical protein ABI760_00290 [Ferruginibacter sp.]
MKKYLFAACLLNGPVGFSQTGNIGIGTVTPRYSLSFAPSLGQKIALWDDGNVDGGNYGIGVQSGLLQLHTYTPLDDIVMGYGSSNNFTERFRFKGNGFMGIGNNDPQFFLDVSGRIRLRHEGGNITAGLWLNNSLNNSTPAFIGMQGDSYVGWYGTTAGWGLVMNTNSGYTGIGNTSPQNRLDITGLNNYDLANSEGDARIGNASYRIKFGVALSGGGAGASGIMQYGQPGGFNNLALGSQGKNFININGTGNFVDITNATGGLRFDGAAGKAGEVLGSNGSSVAPSWVSPTAALAANTQQFFQSSTVVGVVNYVGVPGLSQSFTCPAGKGMFILQGQMFNNGCFACGNQSCKYDIVVDGVLIDRNFATVANGGEAVVTNGATLYNLTAGTHTVTVNVDGNGGNFTASGFRIVLMVIPQ